MTVCLRLCAMVLSSHLGILKNLCNFAVVKIAIVHYRFFPGDGPERYLFNIIDLLERNGHTVAPFSVANSRNEDSYYSKFFLKDIGDEVHFGDSGRSLMKTAKALPRMFWSTEARRKFGRFLDEFQPDIVYVLQYHNKISPSFIPEAKKRGIPVVHRISDFQYMCPNAIFFSHGRICEACLEGHSFRCIKQRCVRGSLAMSVVKLAAKKYHDAIGIKRKIDAFVVPSGFTLSRLLRYGIDEKKLVHIPTFYNVRIGKPASELTYEPFFLFIGRITEQKGVRTLVEAFADTDMPLKIIGTSADNLEAELKASLEGRRHKIEFLGFQPFEKIAPWLERCRATIVPSIWYDNFPNTILESFGFAKPVIASSTGSLLETVIDGETGLTFSPGNAGELRKAARRLLANEQEARTLGANAQKMVETRFSEQAHYDKLMRLFADLIAKK